MLKKFYELPKWAQVILLLIPGVNWVMEVVIRVLLLIEKQCPENIVGMVVATFLGIPLGWVDIIFLVTTKELVLTITKDGKKPVVEEKKEESKPE